jgi:hypothetical protein
MRRERKALYAKVAIFKRVYGVTPDTFHKMSLILKVK